MISAPSPRENTMESLTKAMGSTRLSDEPEEPEQLLFNPSPESGIEEAVLDNIPRYLFRLATPKSAGITNERWVCSESVRQNGTSSKGDIFFNLDTTKRTDVARTLNTHLRWDKMYNPEDNFVSWTSSLLFVLQYIYYRHYRDKTSPAEIKLYIIDTMEFPRRTFMRDLDLIDIFCENNKSLKNFQFFRNQPQRNGDRYYFGEYLSQGSLKIENKCQVITADILLERDRLHRIQPEFVPPHCDSKKSNPQWAKEVNRLRKAIWSPPKSPSISPNDIGDGMQAIQEILEFVSPEWKYPMAIYFAALIGPESSKKGKDTADDKVVGTNPRSMSLPCELFKRFCP